MIGGYGAPMRSLLTVLSLTIPAVVATTVATAADPSATPGIAMTTPASATTAHSFTLTTNAGLPAPLSAMAGKVVLLVNTASKCGLTPQYAALEKLYLAHKDQGLVVVGVPANEFGGQEPGSDEQIKTFCTTKYHVTFPLMKKIVVKGDGIDPLYQWLTTASPKPGVIAWNFTKFLIGPDGQVLNRFEPKTTPDAPEVTAAITAALQALAKKP